MTDIKSMTLEELTAWLKEQGEPAFRAKQIFHWLYRGVSSFDEMTDLSKALREKLSSLAFLTPPQVARKQVSRLDGTIKYLWELSDGNCVESVLMRYQHGNTVCISCQVGCRMGCAFCASTLAGKVRNLTPAEMIDQVLFTQLDSGAPISNIVLMGIGEPLDNFETVMKFLTLVNHPEGLNIGMRHISLSTCGLTEQIDKLAQYGLQLTLSVSLHAPDDETRSRIMPVNRSVGVEKLMDACRRYFQTTGRRISYEYAMIDGVNDSDRQADLLAGLLKGMPGHVNLIPLNDVEESPLKPSRRVAAFQKRLERHGVTVTVRRRLGSDIDASCGQLRRKAMQETEPAGSGPGRQPEDRRERGRTAMNVWGITDRGVIREQNQDAFAHQVLPDGRVLALVCDRMGGARAGNVASTMAVDIIMDEFLAEEEGARTLDSLKAAAALANRRIFQRAAGEESCAGMGTTLVAALADGEEALILNEGDSRAYHLSEEGGIVRVTRDHSLVEDLVQRGELTREQARTHPHKNLITRALGAEPELRADVFRQPLAAGGLSAAVQRWAEQCGVGAGAAL